MGNVYVINMNGVDAKTGEIDPVKAFTHVDSYDGQEYTFPPKEKVLVSTDAASHMLGFNKPDKSETLVRLGWATRYDPATKTFAEDPDGVRKLARFIFDEAVMVSKSSLAKVTHDNARTLDHSGHV